MLELILLLLYGLVGLCALGSLICFVLVLIQMFQNGDQTMGIVTIATCFIGIGGIVGFVYGWIKSREWGIQPLMLAWTACIGTSVVLGIGGLVIMLLAFQRLEPIDTLV